MTHGEWIRAKSDAGLSLWLWGRMIDSADDEEGCWLHYRNNVCPYGTEMSCCQCFETWMGEEQEEKHE